MVGTSSCQGGFGALGPNVVTELATGTKNITQVANFANSREKTTKPYFEQGCQFELKLQKSRLFCQTRKTACQQKESNCRKAELVFFVSRNSKT